MTRSMLAVVGAGAVAASVTLAAQTPTTPPTPTQPPSASQPQRDADTITVTGCLKAWEDSAGGARTPGATTPAPATAARFLLTNAEEGMGRSTPSTTTPPSSTPPSTTTPPAGMPPRSGSASPGKQYVVTAESGVNLTPHLNHQVRITGKKTAASATTPAPRPSEPKPGDPAKPGAMDQKNLDSIVASSVTMVSATCPAGTQ